MSREKITLRYHVVELRALALQQMRAEKHAEAIATFRRLLDMGDLSSTTLINMCICLLSIDEPLQAKKIFSKIDKKNFRESAIYDFLDGLIKLKSGQNNHASKIFERLTAQFPENPEYRLNYALCLAAKLDYSKATELLKQVGESEAYREQATIELAFLNYLTGRPIAAIDLLQTIGDQNLSERGLKILCLSLIDNQQVALAKKIIEISIEKFGPTPDSLGCLHEVFHAMQDTQSALKVLDEALSIKDDHIPSLYNKGKLLQKMNRNLLAYEAYKKAIELRPSEKFLRGAYVDSARKIGIYDDQFEPSTLGKNRPRVDPDDAIEQFLPFASLSTITDPKTQLLIANKWAQLNVKSSSRVTLGKLGQASKPRIGFFSADLHHHAMSLLLTPLFKRLDESRFEFHLISIDNSKMDDKTTEMLGYFQNFHDISSTSLDGAIDFFDKKLSLDLAFDLNGYTTGAKPELFKSRVARVQINYLGYPGTCGEKINDIILGDTIITPSSHHKYYSERVINLATCYQPNDLTTRPTVKSSGKTSLRRDLGLPVDGFIFCNFNNTFKISKDILKCWIEILRTTEDSHLALLNEDKTFELNVLKFFEQHKVDPARIIFLGRTGLEDHFQRMNLCDLFLDTFPYGAHTTGSDALWSGLPILTMSAGVFASRVCSSILYYGGGGGVVTDSFRDYVSTAVRIRNSPELYDRLRVSALASHESVLFDGEYFSSVFHETLTHITGL
jgi:protein O-GlcNAc transferase